MVWSLTQDYTYDSDLDYLTLEVISHDVSSTTSWTYDAAGNRSNSGYTYDSLNRMTASPGSHTYTNDILGNRTWRDGSSSSSSAARYTWDEVGRMFSYCTPTSGAKYWYRADGMRSQKIEGLSLNWVETKSKDDETSSGYYDPVWASNKPTTRYYYDGQMACEEDYTNGSTYTTTRYGIGARGVDYIAKTASSTTVAYPLYDAHGNMISTVNTSGTIADGRYFDAWGNIVGTFASGSSTGDPKGRFCANIGHVQDDESGLIYMRARYYEPATGKFLSEDINKQGLNWYSYCGCNPVMRCDASGAEWYDMVGMQYLKLVGETMAASFGFAFATASAITLCVARTPAEITEGVTCAIKAVFLLGVGWSIANPRNWVLGTLVTFAATTGFSKWLAAASLEVVAGGKTLAWAAVGGYFAYSLLLWGVLFSAAVDDAAGLQ